MLDLVSNNTVTEQEGEGFCVTMLAQWSGVQVLGTGEAK